MHEREAMPQAVSGWLVASSSETTRQNPQPLAEAISCLREARVLFAVFQRDFEAPHRLSRLDFQVEPGEFEVALAALRRPGFREMRDAGEGATRVFLTYEADRFYAVAVHPCFEHAGLEYLETSLAFSRRDLQGAWPRLCAEDRFLHLLLSLALDGRMPTEAERLELLNLRREPLDLHKLSEQTERLGLRRCIEAALSSLDVLLQERRRWNRFRLRLWLTLLRQPGNLRLAWNAWKQHVRRLRFRPVVLAVMGPPGAGKTAFIDAVEEQLAATPLAAGRVQMSCWAGGAAWTRLCRVLAPVEPAFGRLLRGRRGRSVQLMEEEWRILREKQPGTVRLLVGAGRQALQSLVFNAFLLARLASRHVRGIRRCRRPLVLADGWIGDLGFRLEEPASQQGKRRPPRFFRHIPMPDGILYRSTSYALAASRKPQLQREQFENVDLGLRRMLRPLQPLEFISDESPRHVARTFLRRYWAHLLERHNQHA